MTKTISSSDPRTIATRALDKISASRDERSALADLVLLTPTILLAIRSVL